ncbi:MAG: TraR/DksA family transcriptional regulator [Verrucomicrobiota bacterium]|nr:TraR/DksA family transcriptional regulator [Verrucomicrobiota bacterium]
MANANDQPVPPATSEQILGRPVDAAEKDISSVVAGEKIEPRWREYYERLLRIRDGVIDEETRLQGESRENQPQFITDIGAESASSSITRDMALGRVSGYQEMLDEINLALSRVESGTYGVCELTGKPIAPDRLKAIPWTRFSLEAEEQLERDGKAPVRFELAPQFTTRDASSERTAPETAVHRDESQHRA